ncbi:glycosyltransferase family 2 protein [Balneola sp. MJW-20]|uniref:glycosyltransferase family 2 protein n=1 Tax=Gracilimonas aurantiaca TaxID=3234185 RepID=UPI0034675BB7
MDLKSLIEPILNFLEPLDWFFILYFVFVNLTYIMLVVISLIFVKKQKRYSEVFNLTGLFKSDLYAPISILAPAYNEEMNIVSSIEALLQLQYPDFEVVVINDGSTDDTLMKLIEHFELYSVPIPDHLELEHKPIKSVFKSERYANLKVVDKVNGRKADALNAGINISSKDLICSIDADSILDPTALRKMLKAFVEDENVIAAGGIVRIANGCKVEDYIVKEVGLPKKYLGRIQSVEYLRSFLFGRIGWDYLKSLLIISGAFGVFDRKAVMRVGGYLHDTVGEDMELVVRLHRYFKTRNRTYSIRFLPEPVCWTEVPNEWPVLGRQRNRWQRGLAETLWRHKGMLFNPKYGRLGFLAMPYFLFVELLGPIFEFVGFVYFFLTILAGNVNPVFTTLFLSSAILLGMILSISAVICEEFTYRRYPSVKDVLILTWYAFLENLGFRQIHTWWRFTGLVDFLKGDKEWGEMIRSGLESKKEDKNPKRKPSDMLKQFKLAGYWSVLILIPMLLVLLILSLLIDLSLIPDLFNYLPDRS